MTLGRDVEQGIRRAGWWGFFVACVLLAIPILIRVSFGVFDTTVGLALVAELTLLVALPPWPRAFLLFCVRVRHCTEPW
jgi:hypothetical protein